jgi:hypothetical protein
MKNGIELQKEIESKIEYLKSVQKNRDERIANNETDEDDCFISIKLTAESIRHEQSKLELIRNGCKALFESFFDTETGEELESKDVETKYGTKLRLDAKDYFSLIERFNPAKNRIAKKIFAKYGFDQKTINENWQNENFETAYNEAKAAYYADKGFRVELVEKNAWINSCGHYIETKINYAVGQ